MLALAACGEADPIPPATGFDVDVFRSPPPELGPHVRWWWPGGAVDDATIEREVGRLADAGFAGIEQQTLAFGLGPADLSADPRVRTVGEPAELARVQTFVRAAHARGLSATVTLGSGWPSGGIFRTDVRPVELLVTRVDVSGPAEVSIPIPTPSTPGWVSPSNNLFPVIGAFDPSSTLIAVLDAPVLDAAATPPALGAPVDVTDAVVDGALVMSVPDGLHALLFVQRHTVDHLVAGAAFPGGSADAKVIDHLDPRGAAALLAEQAGPWLDALAPEIPDELFIDSFELVSELPWSIGFERRFTQEKGYPLLPEVPFVLRANGEAKYVDLLRGPSPPAFGSDRGARAREDYEDVRASLFHESFVEPMVAFAGERGAALRLQAHGGYDQVLDGYAAADIPEAEGLFAKGSMDFLRLASSAAHVTGRVTVSSESFIAVNPIGTPLSADERWMLAGRAYAAGINRLVFHGIAYPYVRSNGATWSPFLPDPSRGVVTAGPFPITSDLQLDASEWADLAAFNLALTRLSYAMTRGTDRAEVAWLLDERELPDESFLRTGDLPAEQGESPVSLALRGGGYGYDRISAAMLARASAVEGRLHVGASSYGALLITDWPSAQPEELAAVNAALDGGIPVLVLGSLPSRARGLQDAADRDAQVAVAVERVATRAHVVPSEAALAATLAGVSVVPGALVKETTCPRVSLNHRAIPHGELFLVFNEHEVSCTATLELDEPGDRVRVLDPRTGDARDLPTGSDVSLALEARRPVVLFIEHR